MTKVTEVLPTHATNWIESTRTTHHRFFPEFKMARNGITHIEDLFVRQLTGGMRRGCNDLQTDMTFVKEIQDERFIVGFKRRDTNIDFLGSSTLWADK
jgi:hypothetical protein